MTKETETGNEAPDKPLQDALGILDDDKLAGVLRDKFLTSEEQKTQPEQEVQDEPESEDTETESSEEETDLSQEADEQAESDEVEESEEEEEDKPSLPKGVQKRISKLAAKKKAAEEKAEAALAKVKELEARLNASEPQKSEQRQEPSSDFVQALKSVDDVDREMKSALDIILLAEANPDGVVLKVDGQEREFTSEELKEMKLKAIKFRESELPARKRYLEAETQVEKQILNEYPWWNKPDSPEYGIASQVIKDFPQIKQKRPDWKHVVGLFVDGIIYRNSLKSQAEQKAVTQTKVVKKAPAQPGLTSAGKPTQTQSEIAKAKAKFKRDLSSDSLAQVIKAMGI